MHENDWDDNVYPQAYLITLRTHRTWLHGDERGSVDLHGKNIYGTPMVESSEKLKSTMRENLTGKPFVFDKTQRTEVKSIFESVCKFKGYELLAINIRTNHVHAVISASCEPEVLINLLKRKATRRLRELNLIAKDESPWSRGGSRRYLWKSRHVDAAIDYVLYCQEDIPFDFQK